MKIKFFFATVLPALAFFNSGCSKDNTTNTTTPCTPTVLVPLDVLTGATWQPGELRALENNTTYYYKRGIPGAWNFDLESVLFKTNLTGTYADASGVAYPLTWNFTNAEKTSLTFIIQYGTPLTVNWEGMTYSSTKIGYTQYLTRSNGTNSLASGYRIPK